MTLFDRSVLHDVGVLCIFEIGGEAAKVGGGLVHRGEDGFRRRLAVGGGNGCGLAREPTHENAASVSAAASQIFDFKMSPWCGSLADIFR